MRIKFSGHSDDNVELEIDAKKDEWGCYQSDDDALVHLSARVTTIGGSQGVIVYAIYDGTWSFAVSKLDDGRSVPAWTFTVADEHEYSTSLTIETGTELVTVERVERQRGSWVALEA